MFRFAERYLAWVALGSKRLHENLAVAAGRSEFLKSAGDKSAASDFVQFVTEGRGRLILEQGGFRAPDSSHQPARHK